MQHAEFVGQVQTRARLPGAGEAEAAIQATFQALGERLTEGAKNTLAAQLPHSTARPLLQARSGTLGGGAQAFAERVCELEREDPGRSLHHARAVLSVLTDAVSAGQLEDTLAQLPADLDQLILAGSEGELRL